MTIVLRRTPLDVSMASRQWTFGGKIRFYKWEAICTNVGLGPNHVQALSGTAFGSEMEINKMKILITYLTTTKLWPSQGRTPYVL